MDDPIVTNDFIKTILLRKKEEIIGLAVSKPGQFKTRKKKFDLEYALCLFIIGGIIESFRKANRFLLFEVKKYLSKIIKNIKSPSIVQFARDLGIPTWRVDSVNDPDFLKILRKLEPEVIINQTQEILKEDFISIAKLGVLNRHNSLLPKYRGRLAPFWVLFNREKMTGVSIHFVTAKIDRGPIIVQKSFPIDKSDNFSKLTRKCYKIAIEAMIEALEVLSAGSETRYADFNNLGSYYSTPRLKHAIQYRLGRLRRA